MRVSFDLWFGLLRLASSVSFALWGQVRHLSNGYTVVIVMLLYTLYSVVDSYDTYICNQRTFPNNKSIK